MKDSKNVARHRDGSVSMDGKKGQIVFSFTMPDGQKRSVREAGIKKNGWDKYAKMFDGATLDMKDKQGNRYQVPANSINDAMTEGLSPFTTFMSDEQWNQRKADKNKQKKGKNVDVSQWLTQKAKPKGQEVSQQTSKAAPVSATKGGYQPTFADTMKWMETMGQVGGALSQSEESRKQLSKPAKPALDVERSSFWGKQPNNIKKAGERVQIKFDEERAMDQTAANLTQKINTELPKAMKAYTDQFRDEKGNIPFGAFGYANSPVGDDRVKTLETARDMINEAGKIREASMDGNFGKGFIDKLTSDSYWSSFLDAKRTLLLKNAVEKESSGKQLTEDEKILLDAAAYNMYALAVNNPKLPRGYKVGSAVSQSLPFMLEFVVNPLSGSSKAIAKKMTDAVLKRFAGIAKRKVAKKVLDVSARQLANIGAATGMTATTGLAGTTADALKRNMGNVKPEITNIGTIGYGGVEGGENIGKAFLKAGAARTIDNWSEMVGSQFGEILPAVGRLFKGTKLGTKVMDSALGKAVTGTYDDIMSTSTAQTINKIKDAVQLHGITGEFAEEMLAGIGNAIVVGDQELNTGERGVFNKDNMIDTYLTVAVMGAVPAAGTTLGYAASKLSNSKLKAADAAAGKAMGNSWPQMREQILNASNEARADYLKQVVTSPVFSTEDKKAVLTYVGEVAKREAAAEFRRMKKDDPAYSAYENRRDIINNYNEASTSIGEEQKREFDNYASYDDWYLQNRDASEEKSDDAYLYFNARQDMYDYVDEMNARIKDRVDARMQEVDNLTNPDTGEVMTVASNYYQNPVNIVGGRLVFDEAGNVDAQASDKIIYYVDNNGKRMMATPDKFTSLVSRASAADMRQTVQQEEESSAWAEQDQEMAKPEIKVEDRVVLPDGTAGVVTEINDEGYIVRTDNGQYVPMGPDQLQLEGQPATAKTASPEAAQDTQTITQPESQQVQQPAGTAVQTPEQVTQQPETGTVQQPTQSQQPADQAEPIAQDQPAEMQQAPVQIPQDEKGNYMFTQVPPSVTYAYLNTQDDLTSEEASGIIEENIKEAQKRFDKIQKAAPKPIANLAEYRAKKAKWEQDNNAAQAELDYWNQVKAISTEEASKVGYIDDSVGKVEVGESEDVPANGEELASQMLSKGKIKLLRDSYMKETGFGSEEAKKMFGLFASKEKGGVSIERAGELLEREDREGGYNIFAEGDVNAGRNAIISLLQNVRTMGDLNNYTRKSREARMQNDMKSYEESYANFIMDNFGMTVEEYKAYEDMRSRQVLERYLSEADKNAIIEEFISSEEPIKQEENGTTEGQQPVSGENQGSSEVLQGEQPVSTGGTERTETESGETGGGVVDENGTASEQGVEVSEPQIEPEETPKKDEQREIEKTPGLVRDEMAEGEADADLIDAIAKRLGVTVRFVKQVAGGAANAQIVGNTIEIEKGNENPVKFLLGHEITHRIQDLSPEAYDEFKQYVKMIMGDMFEFSVDRMKKAYDTAGIAISETQLEDEVTADYAGNLAESRGALEKFINQTGSPTLWQRIKEVLESVMDLFRGKRQRQMREAVRLLNNALKEAEVKAKKETVKTSRSKYHLIGIKGATNLDAVEESNIRLDNLEVARNMESQNFSPQSIKMATGWERGADGKWKYEILEGKLKDDWKQIATDRSVSLKDILDYPELFSAYPDMKYIYILVEDMKNLLGAYDYKSKTIYLDKGLTSDADKVLSHEIQHAIQHTEGFALGGDGSESGAGIDSIRKRLEDIHNSDEYKQAMDDFYKEVVPGIEKRIAEEYSDLEEYRQQMIKNAMIQDAIEGYRYKIPILQQESDLQSELYSLQNGNNEYSRYVYDRLSGEVEARNVEHRMDMSPDERMATLSQETEDISRKDQIFIFNSMNSRNGYDGENVRYSIRTKPAPKKTVKAYKLMKVDADGKLHFPFAMVGQEVPLGVWMDAEDASSVNAKGERKTILTFRGGGKSPAAPRPGFHAGDMPYAAHIGIGGNQQQREKIGAEDVWVEAEMAADVDYQQEATENGRNPKTGKVTASKADIRDRVPVDGFYRYKTNPNMKGQWLIGGSMKLNRVLSDQEVNDILDEMGADVQRMPRDGGSQTQEWFDNINKVNASDNARYSIRMTPEMESIIEEAKANDTYMKAPNGNPTNLTERQWAQVRTKAFKDWFGDWENDPENASKVVDTNGEPKVVYHGTPNRFYEFNPDRGMYGAMYFSDSMALGTLFSGGEDITHFSEDAIDILDKADSLDKLRDFGREFLGLSDLRVIKGNGPVRVEKEYTTGGNTSSLVYKPGQQDVDVFDRDFADTEEEVIQSIREDLKSDYEFQESRRGSGMNLATFLNLRNPIVVNAGKSHYSSVEFEGERMSTEQIFREAKDRGNDGVIVRDVVESDGRYRQAVTDYIVSDPAQIKSATDNTGEFSASNPDIRFSLKNTEEMDRIKEAAIADGTFMKAPNGADTKLNERQWLQVRTENFLNWFGDWINNPSDASKVVDENGEPLVMHHGTEEEFYTFKYGASTNAFDETPSAGYMFTDSESAASNYGDVMDVFLSVKEMNDYRDKDKLLDVVAQNYEDFNNSTDEFYFETKEDAIEAYSKIIGEDGRLYAQDGGLKEAETMWHVLQNKLQAISEENGFDGFIINDSSRGEEHTSICTFTPAQIKSATDNTGEFSSDNPDIRFSIKTPADLSEEAMRSGMKGVLGDSFNDAMTSVHSSLPKSVKDSLSDYAVERHASQLSDLSQASDVMSQAISDYLGKMSEEAPEAGWWDKTCASVRKALKNAGYDIRMNDNDVRYLLWSANKDRSQLKPEPQPIIPRDRYENKQYVPDEAKMANMSAMDAIEETRFSIRMNQDDRSSLEQKIKNSKFREGWQDKMIALRHFQDTVEKMSGKKISDFENAYDYENTTSGRATYDYDNYKQNFMTPVTDAIRDLIDNKDKNGPDKVRSYMKAKHGLERNALMRQRAIDKREKDIIEELGGTITPANQALYDDKMDKKKAAEAKTDYAGLTGLYMRLAKPTNKPKMTDIEAYMIDLVNNFEKGRDKKKIDALWAAVKNATGYAIDYLVKTNVMDKEGAKKIKDQYQFYIPLREWQEETAGDKYTYYTENGSDAFFNPIMKAEGRTSESGDPLASMELMALSSFLMGQKNMTKLRLLRMVRNHPTSLANVQKIWYVKDASGQWVEAVPDISQAKTEEEVADIVDKFEKDMEAKKATKDAVQKRSKLDVGMNITKRETKQHQVRVKELGIDYVINFNMDPSVAQAVNGLNRVNMPVTGFFGWYGRMKRYLTSSMTSYNIDFVPTNAWRDLQTASTNAFVKDGFKKFGLVLGYIPKSAYQLASYIYRGKLHQELKEFLENGGETGYVALRKYEELRDELEKDISRYKKSNIVKDFFKAFGKAFSMANRLIENIMRFSTFLASRKIGKSILQSIKDAKDASTNFDRKGSGQMGSVMANQLYFFFNPTVQSIRYHLHLWGKHPIRMSMVYAFWISVANIIPYAIWMGKEDEYQSIPEYIRRGNICIPKEEGYVTLPIPYDLKPAFVMGDIMYSYSSGKYKGDEDLAVRDAILAMSEMSPHNFLTGTTSLADAPSNVLYNFIPDLITPVTDVVRNQTFSGRPIYKDSEYMKYVPEYRKVYKGTPEFMVNASKWLNEAGGGDYATKGKYDYPFLNPSILEYVFMGYVGGAVPSYWRGFKSAYNKLNEEYVATNDIPIVRRFYKEWLNENGVPNNNITQRYFDYSEKVRKFDSEWNQYLSGIREPSLEESDRQKLIENFPKHVTQENMIQVRSIIQYTDEIVEGLKEAENISNDEQKKKLEQKIYEVRKDAVDKIDKLLKSKE